MLHFSNMRQTQLILYQCAKVAAPKWHAAFWHAAFHHPTKTNQGGEDLLHQASLWDPYWEPPVWQSHPESELGEVPI